MRTTLAIVTGYIDISATGRLMTSCLMAERLATDRLIQCIPTMDLGPILVSYDTMLHGVIPVLDLVVYLTPVTFMTMSPC